MGFTTVWKRIPLSQLLYEIDNKRVTEAGNNFDELMYKEDSYVGDPECGKILGISSYQINSNVIWYETIYKKCHKKMV